MDCYPCLFINGLARCVCDEMAFSAIEHVEDELPPLIPIEPPASPLLDELDETGLLDAWKRRQREIQTERYKDRVDEAVNLILGDKTAQSIKAELMEKMSTAKDASHLRIKLFTYKNAWMTDDSKFEDPQDFDASCFNLGDYVDRRLNTWVGQGWGRVHLNYLLRKTNLLDAVVKRISASNRFIIKRHMGVVTEYDAYKTAEPELWLEFWPKGVTLGRRIQCEVW